MKAEEKAKELIESFWKMGNLYAVTTYAHAKACALICVEEIIKEQSEIDNTDGIKYWQQVKQHLK